MALPGYGQQSTSAHASRPNILWITCEDMSANLECFGDSTVSTPNLNKLAAEGIRYTNFYSVAGVCAPSRSGMITGMYPTSIGTQHMRTTSGVRNGKGVPAYQAVPPPEVKCFPEYLRAAGYYCTNNVKTDYQVGEPFTVWDECSNKAHWRNRPADKPFFSVVNLTVTHESQIWKRKEEPLQVDPNQVKLPPFYPESPVIRRDVARYYDNIRVMDSLAGNVLKELAADGLLENTIIFFFSDHGAGLPWYKRELYDRGIQAPLIIRFPGKSGAGTLSDELVSFIDLAPSVLSLANVKIPTHIQGQAFLGDKKAASPRHYIYAARDRLDEQYDMVRAVRDKKFKYIRNYQPDKPNYMDLEYRRQMGLMQEILRLYKEDQLNEVQARWFATKPVEELYDTEKDTFELKNLAGDPAYQEVLIKMRNAHVEWAIQTRDKGFMSEKDMVDLMWPNGGQPVTEPPQVTVMQQTKRNSTVKLTCSTIGASIAYKLGKNGSWTLYSAPIQVSKGTPLTAKAIRYGYQESPEMIHHNTPARQTESAKAQ